MFSSNIPQKVSFPSGVTWSDARQGLIHSGHTKINLMMEERIEPICEDVEITSMSILTVTAMEVIYKKRFLM